MQPISTEPQPTLIFATENSTYEVDRNGHRIRRLNGTHVPTPRQGEDGAWKHYEQISAVVVGAEVLIIWQFDDGIARATSTSRVRTVSTVC
jgi:hypothetical protein